MPGDRSRHDLRPNRIQAVLEARRDAEIAATPAQAPEQIAVLFFTRTQRTPIGSDHINR
jgi:hypothetical protein